MVKLVTLYENIDDSRSFDQHYQTVHIPLLKKYPGLRRLETTRITGATPGETRFSRMTELYFDSQDAMDTALASPEGKAVTRDLMTFAGDLAMVFFGEIDGEPPSDQS